MGELITKPDANPILLAVLNCFVCGIPAGYFMMGQQKKGIFGLIYVWVLMPFMGIGWILALVFAYDAYLLGQKLASGESVEDSENGVDFLGMLPGFS